MQFAKLSAIEVRQRHTNEYYYIQKNCDRDWDLLGILTYDFTFDISRNKNKLNDITIAFIYTMYTQLFVESICTQMKK